MIVICCQRFWSRVYRLGTSVLLLLLPACGLSDYETLMRQTQEREQRFRDEKKLLDEPVKIPTRKEKDSEVPLAKVFFRPPKGIQASYQPEPFNNLLWRYPSHANSGDFARVEMAFAEDSKDFATEVLRHYPRAGQGRTQEFASPSRAPLSYDIWEFDNDQEGYTISILRGGKTQVAIVYVYNKTRREALRKVINLSLESLAVDQQANAARQRYERKSPWKLQTTRAP